MHKMSAFLKRSCGSCSPRVLFSSLEIEIVAALTFDESYKFSFESQRGGGAWGRGRGWENNFAFETFFNGNFVVEWCKDNFGRYIGYTARLVGPILAKVTRLRECIRC